MGRNKLAKFEDMRSYAHVFELSGSYSLGVDFQMKGSWNSSFFKNNNPIVLELGCGKGEYTIGLARLFPDKNFIGVDIKGARMWSAATESLNSSMGNVAFLRTRAEMIGFAFATGEVSEIWLTFPDPQMKKITKRLTSTFFLERYRNILVPGGLIHLKSDSNFLFTYTRLVAEKNNLPVDIATDNLYECGIVDTILSIRTYYEEQWIARGIPIKYIKLRLPDGDRLIEPDVEIEIDDYRSFNRMKRSSLEKRK